MNGVPFVPYEQIPERVRDALRDVYTPRGVRIWWNAPNPELTGTSPRELWESGPMGQGRVQLLADTLAVGEPPC